MKKKHAHRRSRYIDIMIIILCLSVMAYSINLFRLDLFQTIHLYNVQPIGTITARNNVVQRRIADRLLWDRLAVESPVYLGDLIHTAEFSAVTIDMKGQQIDLRENTLIRIQPVTGGALQIVLVDGSLDVSAAADGGSLQLDLMGRKVKISGETTLSATVKDDRLTVQVNRGTAAFMQEGKSREISSGTMITLDSAGIEKIQPAEAITPPNMHESSPVISPVSFFLVENTVAGKELTLTPLEPEQEPEPEGA